MTVDGTKVIHTYTDATSRLALQDVQLAALRDAIRELQSAQAVEVVAEQTVRVHESAVQTSPVEVEALPPPSPAPAAPADRGEPPIPAGLLKATVLSFVTGAGGSKRGTLPALAALLGLSPAEVAAVGEALGREEGAGGLWAVWGT